MKMVLKAIFFHVFIFKYVIKFRGLVTINTKENLNEKFKGLFFNIYKYNIENIINLYINEKGIKVGLIQLKNILEKVILTLKNFNDSNNIDEGKILEYFNKIKEKEGFLRKKETIIPKNEKTVTEYNNYLDRLNESVINSINKSVFYLVKHIIDKQINNLNSILGNLNYNIFEDRLNKINFQANKRFGGNIIAREMIGNNFYDKYYLNKFINNNLSIKINSIFNKVSILEFFKKRQNDLNSLKDDILTEICEKEFEKLKYNISIIDVLKENANLEKIRFNEYIKKELDLTSKLTKPFWSAQKSPELSWTECYYIGSVRDETITNGITEKPNEAIDFWIRNQAGERSKQAKYVETTNPYSIDVIHIMMGACAAYLPEIQNYKQYYLKLLSSKTYPLHLDEGYVGFDDLDISTQQLLDEYCLAKAYGAIIKIDDEYVLNLKKSLEYIYNSKFSLGVEDIESLEDKNIKKEEINMELILGKNEADVLNKLTNNKNILEFIKKFLNMCNKKYTTKYLLDHKKKYISELIMKENIIAYEKLKYKTSH
ncbi:hypothetical protein [Clostridium tarantellae]|uniref:Uncharacterized protein n=1 Tax=Clostridium tarantellae TaxID=39493 RepID=A0A6I1MMQ4_9CLOT|nr:hypothetical protein [Clostridium tarantellae]MPQ44675.1 hypothetical protein [Clostridium tarantellae]